jgi:hypothetical protein
MNGPFKARAANTRARAGRAKVAAMQRAVLLARTNPAPRASKAEDPRQRRRRIPRGSRRATSMRPAAARPVNARRLTRGGGRRQGAPAPLVAVSGDRVTVDDDEARLVIVPRLGAAAAGWLADRVVATSANEAPRGTLDMGRRRGRGSARGARAWQPGSPGTDRPARDGPDPRSCSRCSYRSLGHPAENLQSGSGVACQREGPGLERSGRRPRTVRTAGGRRTEGIPAVTR